MKKILILGTLSTLVLRLGSVLAQDEEAEFQLPSKVVPAEIYACNWNDGFVCMRPLGNSLADAVSLDSYWNIGR